jgi:hypothetical protein
MPKILNQRVMGQYNLTCRTNSHHKKNEWCGSCLWNQQNAVPAKQQAAKNKPVSPKKPIKTMSKTVKPKKVKKPIAKKKSNPKSLTLVPVPQVKTPRTKSSPIDYYNCLLTYANQGWHHPVTGEKKKITACCRDCKLQAPTLNNQRDKELVKFISSYKQLGDSFAKLLRPIK